MKNDLFANLIIDTNVQAIDKSFLYHIPKSLADDIKIGDKVLVPFGSANIKKEAFVIYINNKDGIKKTFSNDEYMKNDNAFENAKDIIEIIKNKLSVSSVLIKIAMYMSKRYMTPLAICLKTALPVKEKVNKNIRQTDVIEKYEKENKNINELNEEQEKAVCDLIKSYKEKKYSKHLLYGITGSGKTEVYIRLIEEVIKDNKKVILLIPEIALTYQTVSRLKEKFENIALINSHMSKGERYIQIKKCLDNKADIIIGARSAIFAPFEDLGLIIIDEEDDMSYKSDKSPRYDTYDIADYRAKIQNAMLLSLSATPKISRYYMAKSGEIILHKLTKKASKNAKISNVNIIDMRKEFALGNKSEFSKYLKEEINKRLQKKEQVMLYMNRRGFSRSATCIDCGETLKCPHCDVALSYHNDDKLKCHYCGYEIKGTDICPKCHGRLTYFGMGTQKLEKNVKEIFKPAKVLRMDRDTVTKKESYDEIIKKFKNKEADILIGTQMIAKGHDFENLTLVCIMCADMNLNEESYKAAEDSFSLFTQIIGRTGRRTDGECIIQTYEPESEMIKLIKKSDFELFYDNEILFRKNFEYPPFVVFMTVNMRAISDDYVENISNDLKLYLNIKSVKFFGPNIPYPKKVKDCYYRIFYVKLKNTNDAFILRKDINDFLKKKDTKKLLSIQYDIEE